MATKVITLSSPPRPSHLHHLPSSPGLVCFSPLPQKPKTASMPRDKSDTIPIPLGVTKGFAPTSLSATAGLQDGRSNVAEARPGKRKATSGLNQGENLRAESAKTKRRKKRDPSKLKLDKKPRSTKSKKDEDLTKKSNDDGGKPYKSKNILAQFENGESSDECNLKQLWRLGRLSFQEDPAHQAQKTQAESKRLEATSENREKHSDTTLKTCGNNVQKKCKASEAQNCIEGKVNKPGNLKKPQKVTFKVPLGCETASNPPQEVSLISQSEARPAGSKTAEPSCDNLRDELSNAQPSNNLEDNSNRTETDDSLPGNKEEVKIRNPPNDKKIAKDFKSKRDRRVRPPSKIPKRPAKSSRTVTGIALAQFRPQADRDGDSITNKDYRVLLGGDIRAAKGSKSEKKKDQNVKGKLMKPELAMQRMERQDFLFGTSSQLMGGESPEFLRTLQESLRESGASAGVEPHHDATRRISGTTEADEGGYDLLWTAGARGHEEWVLFEPGSAKRLREEQLTGKTLESPARPAVAQGFFADIDNIQTSSPHHADTLVKTTQSAVSTATLQPAVPCNHRRNAKLMCLDNSQASVISPLRPALESISVNALSIYGNEGRLLQTSALCTYPSSKTMQKKQEGTAKEQAPKAPSDTNPKPTERPRGRPKKGSAADATAASANQATRAKTKTSKISLKKQTLAKIPSPNPNPHPEVDPTEADSPFQHIDEISDSDREPPSSPRRNLQKKKENTKRPTSPPAGTPPYEPPPQQQQQQQPHKRGHFVDDSLPTARALLFPKITAAVKGQPRSRSKEKLSWWEKMLLYDPIVLEDFAGWLNGGEGGLRAVGWEGWPILEEYREFLLGDGDGDGDEGNAGGSKRKRDWTMTKREKEKKQRVRTDYQKQKNMVGTLTVQRWCEENSVCCLWREGLRGGVRNRY